MRKTLRKAEEERLLRIVAKGREEYHQGKTRVIESLADLRGTPKKRRAGPPKH